MMPRQKFWLNDMEAVLAIMVALIILGTINIFSASFVLAETQYHNPYFFLTRQLISLGVGTVALAFTLRIDYHHWRRLIPLVMAFTLVSLVLVLAIGTTTAAVVAKITSPSAVAILVPAGMVTADGLPLSVNVMAAVAPAGASLTTPKYTRGS